MARLAKLQRKLAKAQAQLAALDPSTNPTRDAGASPKVANTLFDRVGTPSLLPASPPMSLSQALVKMTDAAQAAEHNAAVAKAAGNDGRALVEADKARGIRREVCMLKMAAAERDYQEHGGGSFGPGGRPLFKTTHSLPDDISIGGIRMARRRAPAGT